jgi:hypothetical protein
MVDELEVPIDYPGAVSSADSALCGMDEVRELPPRYALRLAVT